MKKQIKRVAYMMPPQENWNEFRDPAQRNDNYITDEQYKLLVDCGFTHGMALYEHGADIALRALEIAQRQGLKYYVRDEINWANILHIDFYYLNGKNYREYQKYDSFAGVYIYDEPPVSQYKKVAEMVEGYYKFFGKGENSGEPLVNLLPTYANHIDQLGADTYEEYIRQYVETVPTDYVLYDHYPFGMNKEGGDAMRTDYLYNAEVVAKLCKEYGKEMRTFIQSVTVGRSNYPITSEMVSFQMHTYLCYGTRAIVHYYYWSSMGGTNLGIVNHNGEPRDLYYGVQKTHKEIAEFEEKYCDCVWEKTMYVKGKKTHLNQTEFARFTCEDKDSPFRFEHDGIVGVFDYKGKKAYYAANYTNPRLGLTNEISFDLDGKYEVWCDGKRLACEGGSLQLTLPCGGGAFLLPKEEEDGNR